ncbi:DUF488 domain-containing protein [Cellulosimicrobium cellulans]|uniref:DUF488 domain-containing protein n=1 Tax=Cellulosimicrobium cellulans TaxID=1710 RepID=UPI001EDC3A0C|nr:DUF488 domain-containing protein [Cellulosimicrobium cellulans]UKJ62871.1 DUF488 domain-containing protein [Cellulosimicrobium cellulans]
MTVRHGVTGWGYEGRSVDELVEDALHQGVVTVVDVRLNPISRKRGLSKSALSATLAVAGVEYVHLRALGNPKDNRAGFAETSTAEGQHARHRFQAEVLATLDAQNALRTIEKLQCRGPVLLLCFEATEGCCHRALILDALRARAQHDDRQLVPA